MKAVVFFVCLLSLLLLGNDHIYGAASRIYKNNRSQANNHQQQLKCIHTSQNKTFVEKALSNKPDEYLIDDEVEDKNTTNLSGRKFKWLARQYLMLPETFVLSYFNSSKDQLSIPGNLPCKYITLRVLRI